VRVMCHVDRWYSGSQPALLVLVLGAWDSYRFCSDSLRLLTSSAVAMVIKALGGYVRGRGMCVVYCVLCVVLVG